MTKEVQLLTMSVVAKQSEHMAYKGNRLTSKTEGFTLLHFLRLVFEHNHMCQKEQRLQDHEIAALTADEFSNPDYVRADKYHVSVWRNMFNAGRLHKVTKTKRNFVAYRVNQNLEFTKSTSPTKALTVEQLLFDYEKQGFDLNKDLLDEVKSYSQES